METTVVDRLVERGATHHALKATLTGRQALVGTITPRVQRLDARGVGHGRFERARIDDRSEAGHVTETERRGQTSLDGADLQRLAQPDHVVVAHELRINAVKGGIGRNHAGLEQLGQTVDLKMQAPPLVATGVSVFCEITNSGPASARPMAWANV